MLNDLKKEISVSSKKNFTLEREIRNLDQKIALLIRNRITLEEVMATSGDISLVNKTVSLKDKREREVVQPPVTCALFVCTLSLSDAL